VKTRYYFGGNKDGTMRKLGWNDHENAILFSPSGRRIIVISPSCHRCFITVPSCLHLRTIALLPLYHRALRFRGTKMLLKSKRNTVIRRYLNTRCASRRNLASCFASRDRSSSRDKKIFLGHIPLNSIPFIL
jgi:hypothetical protein